MVKDCDIGVKNRALIAGAQMGNLDVIKTAIFAGADINAVDEDGNTALGIVCKDDGGYCEIDLAKYLLKNGASANAGAHHPLMTAIYLGNKKLVKLLLNYGADVNYVSPYTGITPLFLASDEDTDNAAGIIQLLLDYGADINWSDKSSKETALIVATKYGLLPIVKVLLKNGADVNHQDKDGRTALFHAVFNIELIYTQDELVEEDFKQEIRTNINILKELLKHGGRVDIKDKYGKTLLDYINKLSKQNTTYLRIRKLVTK
jgi:ankyrin repeat protein